MDKKIAGLLAAAGALASLGSAQAATPADPAEMLKVKSYAELLDPIPNASAVLDAVDRAAGDPGANVQLAQFFEYHHHHHHHHHHHGFYRGYGGPRVVVVPGYRRFYHHHHHHHHHHGFYRRYRYDD